MSFSCFRAKCQKIVAFECHCAENSVYSCKKHIGKHQMMTGNHKVESLLRLLNDNERNKLKKMACNTNLYINEAIETLNKSSASAIKTILDETKRVLELLLNYQQMVNKTVKLISAKKEINKKELEKFENLQTVKDFIKVRVEDTEQSFKEYFNILEKTVNKRSDEASSSQNQIDCEFFVVLKTLVNNGIELINLDTLKLSKKLISGYSGGRDLVAICNISKEKVFIYGGCNTKVYEDGYIIDIYTGSAQKIANSLASCVAGAGAVLKNNFIYIFGGCPNDNDVLNTSQSYNIISNEWKIIGNLPIASFRTMASIMCSTSIYLPTLIASWVSYAKCIEIR